MTESKQNLIRHLRTTLVEVKGLPEMIEKEDLYLPDGVHVDTEFMMAMLQYVNNATDAAAAVMRSLQKLLGIDPDEIKADKKKNKEGKKWGVEDVLKHCTLDRKSVV